MPLAVLPLRREAIPTRIPALSFDVGTINMIDPLFVDANGDDSNTTDRPPVQALGQVPNFMARTWALLPGLNTMRIGVSPAWFTGPGTVSANTQALFSDWVAAGGKILWCYANFSNGAEIAGTLDQKVASLTSVVVAKASATFEHLRLYLGANPAIMAASIGMELMNEPAIYNIYKGQAAVHPVYGQPGYFEHLYADHCIRLTREIKPWWPGHIHVGGFRYSANFRDLLVRNAEGVSALDRIRRAVGPERLVWSWHCYPGWISPATSAENVIGKWRQTLAPVAGDKVCMTETNASGTEIADSGFANLSPHFIFEAIGWLGLRDIGTGYFPAFNTGSSSLAVYSTSTGTVSLTHPHAYAETLHMWAADGDVPRGTFTITASVQADYNDPAGVARGTELTSQLAVTFCSDAGETVIATAGRANMIYGGAGNDTLAGVAGARSWIYGIRGNNTLTARGTFDIVRGGTGSDTIISEAQVALLDGGKGNADIRVNAGRSFVITGGGASTVVRFARTGQPHTILALQPTDTIDLALWAPIGPVTVVQAGAHVTIAAGGESITVRNQTRATVAARIQGVAVA